MQSTTLPVEQAHNSLVNTEGDSSLMQRKGLQQTGTLVACFVLPAEQAEKLISVIQDIVRSPASDAPLNLPQAAITSATQSNSWLTHIEAASYLGIAVSTLYRYAEQERIECRKIGNRLEYRRTSLDRFKEQQIRPARRPPRSRYNCADARLRQLRGASLGLYKKHRSPYWWMTYMADGEQVFESTGTTSKNLATKIWRKRENEVTSGKFRLDWPGQRITFEEMCKEFEKSHFAAISENTIKGYQAYLKHLKVFFGEHVLTGITAKLVEEYRDHRRQQPSIRYKGRTLKGATVNRELECLTCILDLSVQRKYIPENPARAVKHFNELRERPAKQMLTLDQENRILNAASPHLRVGIILLVQTGGRTYSEAFRLRWDQVDWENRLIRFGNDAKTPGSSEPLPLTDLAFRVLQKWKEKSRSDSPYIFPSLRKPGVPVGSVKTTWRATLKRAGVPHFPIYNLRHAFCTRLSWVAPDAVIERAMRHTSPETKRIYQLSMVE